MARTRVEITVLDLAETMHAYQEVADRITNVQPAFDDIFTMLEEGEKELFAGVAPKYDRTGDLKRSLTKRVAPGAIRDADHNGAIFGSSIWYGKFLSKSQEDMPLGQISGDRRTFKPSAVLVLQPKTTRRIADLVLDYIVEDFG
jgi:hypothetical protein